MYDFVTDILCIHLIQVRFLKLVQEIKAVKNDHFNS